MGSLSQVYAIGHQVYHHQTIKLDLLGDHFNISNCFFMIYKYGIHFAILEM